jgi:type IV secretory pathway TrbF-like protein
MGERVEHGASGESQEVAAAAAPRRYFDGDEARYEQAAADAEAGENTILQWMRYLKAGVIVLLLVAGVLLGIVLYLALGTQVEVKFVVRNEPGQFRILGWDEFQPEQLDMKAYLELWLRCARAITTDRDTHQRCWQRVSLFVKKHSQCATMIKDYVAQRKPGEQLFHKSVLVEQLQGSREPDGRWRFSWVEKTYQLDHGRSGPLIDTSTWHAIIITTREHPKDPAQIQDVDGQTVNPLGLLCTHLSWWR